MAGNHDDQFTPMENMGHCESVEYDIDSISVLSENTKFFKLTDNFQVPMIEIEAQEMKNVKMKNQLERKLELTGHLLTSCKTYDFLIGEGPFPLYACLRVPLANRVKNLRKKFMCIIINAVKRLHSSTNTRVKGAATLLPGTNSKMVIYMEDWPHFRNNLMTELASGFFQENQIDIYFYVCIHGMLTELKPGERFENFVDNLFNYDELDSVMVAQVHLGIVYTPKDNEIIVNDCERISTFFGVQNYDSYNPYFLSQYGYYSGVRLSSKFGGVFYTHSYTTLHHFIKKMKHSGRLALFTWALLGFDEAHVTRNTSNVKYMQEIARCGKLKMSVIENLIESFLQSSARDLRVEIVVDLRRFIADDDTSGSKCLNKGMMYYYTEECAYEMVNNRLMILFKRFDEHVQMTANKLFCTIRNKMAEATSNSRSRSTFDQLYSYENMLEYWFEGNINKIDYKRLRHFIPSQNRRLTDFGPGLISLDVSRTALVIDSTAFKSNKGLQNVGETPYLINIYNFTNSNLAVYNQSSALLLMNCYAYCIGTELIQSTPNEADFRPQSIFNKENISQYNVLRDPPDLFYVKDVIKHILDPPTMEGFLILCHCINRQQSMRLLGDDLLSFFNKFVTIFPMRFLSTDHLLPPSRWVIVRQSLELINAERLMYFPIEKHQSQLQPIRQNIYKKKIFEFEYAIADDSADDIISINRSDTAIEDSIAKDIIAFLILNDNYKRTKNLIFYEAMRRYSPSLFNFKACELSRITKHINEMNFEILIQLCTSEEAYRIQSMSLSV